MYCINAGGYWSAVFVRTVIDQGLLSRELLFVGYYPVTMKTEKQAKQVITVTVFIS